MLDNPGLYIHFPWCIKKCPYCDFNSHPLRDDVDQTVYLDALLADYRYQCQAIIATTESVPVKPKFGTVFFGGGTPSLFAPEHIHTLLNEVACPEAEVTLETNPGTQERSDFNAYRKAGVNRLSLGAQSFATEKLDALGRVHQANDTIEAFSKARRSGFTNINLDLMWGLPNQSVDEAMSDLRQAIALEPEHISWYQLTIEPKTEFAKRPPLLPIDNTLYEIEMSGLALLAQEGFARYEVSAYARAPQLQCAHNLNYWSFGDYVGIGAGAHGKITKDLKILRTRKDSQPRLYQANAQTTHTHGISGAQLPLEFLMNALRMLDGVGWPVLEERAHLTRDDLEPAWSSLVQMQMLREDRCAVTAKGLRYLDSVLERFVS